MPDRTAAASSIAGLDREAVGIEDRFRARRVVGAPGQKCVDSETIKPWE
ncbi:hypothetical protein [Sphingobium nicotianae]|nr:hypothetical protein [Sphingobium nicotianae]